MAAVSQKELPVAEALIKTTGGVGRWFAREAAYRAFGGRDVTASRMTEQEKAALLEAVTFVQAAYADGGTPVAVVVDGRPVEFSFLPLTQYSGADLVEYGSYSELLESYYAAKDKAERLRQKSRRFGKDRAQSARACRAQSRRPAGRNRRRVRPRRNCAFTASF